MLKSLGVLDRILRGEEVGPDDGSSAELRVPILGLSLLGIALGVIYGLCMGSFALFRDPAAIAEGRYDSLWQVLATTIKVPALFFLTLLITAPSLYVFNALIGSRLRMPEMMRLLVSSLAVNLAVLASLGPIVAFFSVSTPNYYFMLLFNVIVFAVSGLFALGFLLKTLRRLAARTRIVRAVLARPVAVSDSVPQPEGATPAKIQSATGTESVTEPKLESDSGFDAISGSSSISHGAADAADWTNRAQPTSPATDAYRPQIGLVFRCWIVIYGLVGAQMGWVLRPFLGDPELPFTWFRSRESNFFEALTYIVQQLF